MTEFKLILRYLKLILSNWVLRIVFLLDLAGAATTYLQKLNIPYWTYLCLLIIGLIWSGYSIYKNSAPKIIIDKPKQDETSFNFPTVGNEYFRINMKSYITNFGLQSGSIEYIKLKFINVNDIEDEFVLKEIGISGEEGQLSKDKYFPIFPTGQDEKRFKFPMIVEPNTILPFYLGIDISLVAVYGNEEEIRRKVGWLKHVRLELEYKIKDSFGIETTLIPFKIDLRTLPEVLDKAIKTNKAFDETF
ncbi:hypothetical protein [Peribacillus simplex]|uniref:hypothetical protein n=1 Tax=Peribacillus simplex TaxID=1478 RepID=UPI0011DE05D4|nr:hypothetical protein [Peribacillus simplex]